MSQRLVPEPLIDAGNEGAWPESVEEVQQSFTAQQLEEMFGFEMRPDLDIRVGAPTAASSQ